MLAKKNTVIGITKSESLVLKSMQDPTSYRYWTNDALFAWVGGWGIVTGKQIGRAHV